MDKVTKHQAPPHNISYYFLFFPCSTNLHVSSHMIFVIFNFNFFWGKLKSACDNFYRFVQTIYWKTKSRRLHLNMLKYRFSRKFLFWMIFPFIFSFFSNQIIPVKASIHRVYLRRSKLLGNENWRYITWLGMEKNK